MIKYNKSELNKIVNKYSKITSAMSTSENNSFTLYYYSTDGYLVQKLTDDEYYIFNLNDSVEALASYKKLISQEFNKNPEVGKLIYEIARFQYKKKNSYVAINNIVMAIEQKDFFIDRDNLRNLKNSGFNFRELARGLAVTTDKPWVLKQRDKNTGLFPPTEIEELHDQITDVIKKQKIKRLIQKLYSNKYRFLISDPKDPDAFDSRVLEQYEMVIGKNENIKNLKQNFINKISRFSNKDDHYKALEDFVSKMQGWSKDFIEDLAMKMSADIIHSDGNLLCIKINNYEQSKELGSDSWCISYDKKFFKYHKSSENSIYFMFDFSKKPSDKLSMLGSVLDADCNVVSEHWKDDSIVLSNLFFEVDASEQEEKFHLMLPKTKDRTEIVSDIIDSLHMEESNHEYTEQLLKRVNDVDDSDILELGMKSEKFTKKITSSESPYLLRLYQKSKNENISKNLHMRNLLNDWVQSTQSFYIQDFGDQYLNQLFIDGDMQKVSEVFGKISSDSSLSGTIPTLTNYSKEELKEAIEIFKIAKTKIKGNMFDSKNLANILLSATNHHEKEHFSDFIPDFVKLNNGEIDLRKQIKKNICEKPTDSVLAMFYETNEKILLKSLESMSKKSLLSAKDYYQEQMPDNLDNNIVYKKINSQLFKIKSTKEKKIKYKI